MIRSQSVKKVVLTTAAAALLAGACAESELTVSGGSSEIGTRERLTDPSTREVEGDVAIVALEDLGAYWEENLPDLYGIDFEPLAGGLQPYGPDTDLFDCGAADLEYEDIAANALYCPDDDLIAWDEAQLTPFLEENFGPLTVGVVMAHEYAHAIQLRANVRGQTVTLELQADCFAGAWASDAGDRIEMFAADEAALDRAIAGFLELRDELGVTAANPGAHGSGFDRVSSFRDGYEIGLEACAEYESSPPDVVAIPFGSPEDFARGGDLPTSELMDPLLADMETFFANEVTAAGAEWEPIRDVVFVDPATDEVECGNDTHSGEELEFSSFYCVPDNTVFIDGDGLLPELEDIGDFAVGSEVARQYAFAAQVALGIDDDEQALADHADCATGAFTAAEFHGTLEGQQLRLSPGDLDEIVVSFLSFGGSDSSAFDRTGFLRSGFVDGFSSCNRLVG